MEWDVAIWWQLRGLRGTYGMCLAVTGCTWQRSSKRQLDTITATTLTRPIPFHTEYAVKVRRHTP